MTLNITFERIKKCDGWIKKAQESNLDSKQIASFHNLTDVKCG